MSVTLSGSITLVNVSDGATGATGADGQMLYASSSTAAGTQTKVATLSAGTLTLSAGATVAVTFSTANTYTSGAVKLNVSSTGAKDVWYNGAVTSSTNIIGWPAGVVVIFVYDGTHWRVTDAGSMGAVTREQRIWYRSDSPTAPTAPTTWSTTTTNAYNGWSTKVTPAAANTNSGTTYYQYLYTCIQRQTVAQSGTTSCTCTDVLLDDTTTVIDGSLLVKNSVTADHIAASSITIGKIDSSDSDTASAILNSSLQVGGTNLLRSTANLSNTTYWYRNNITSLTAEQTDPNGGTDAVLVIPTSSSWYLASINSTNLSLKDVGETYTFSVWLKAASDTTCKVCVRNLDSDYVDGTSTAASTRMTVSVTTSWQRFAVTGTLMRAQSDTGQNCFWVGQASDVNMYVAWPKCERGNVATDWSPAPEDMATEAEVRAVYGTCSTAAGTTAKVVACDSFQLFEGARVTVKFSTANTTDAPTLNVNGTGDKAIWYNGAVASSSNPVRWGANATLSFVYDGTEWVLDEKPPSYSVSCATAAGTRAKAATVTGALVVNGTRVAVSFTTANTYTANSVQFNLSSTGAASIYVNNTATSSSFNFFWSAGTVIGLVRRGTGWFVDAIDTKYLTQISDAGLLVHRSTDSTTGVQITDSVDILRSGVSTANFGGTDGSTVRVGKATDNHLVMDSAGFKFIEGTEQVGTIIGSHSALEPDSGGAFGAGDVYGISMYCGAYRSGYQSYMHMSTAVEDSTDDAVYSNIELRAYSDTYNGDASLYVDADDDGGRILLSASDGSWVRNPYNADGNHAQYVQLCDQRVLWSGSHYMTATQTAYLSDTVLNMTHGIVIVFEEWDGSDVVGYAQTFFVPKSMFFPVGTDFWWGCTLSRGLFESIGHKSLHLYDGQIEGAASNSASGTATATDIKYNNSRWVMTKVIGV